MCTVIPLPQNSVLPYFSRPLVLTIPRATPLLMYQDVGIATKRTRAGIVVLIPPALDGDREDDAPIPSFPISQFILKLELGRVSSSGGPLTMEIT